MAKKQPDAAPPQPGDEIHIWLHWIVQKRRGKLSDGEIAERAGMTPSRFSQVINGHAGDVRFSTVAAILRAVGAKFSDLDRP